MVLPSFLIRQLLNKWNPQRNCGMLYFHRILNAPDPFFPDDLTVVQFRALLRHLTAIFDIITPHDWLDRDVHLKKPSLMISFDDGYEDNMVAAKILEEFGVRGTFFVSTVGPSSGGAAQSLWQNKVLAYYRRQYDDASSTARAGVLSACQQMLQTLKYQSPQSIETQVYALTRGDYQGLELLNPSHIRRLIKHGHCVAPHTHNHYILSTLSEQQVQQELTKSLDVFSEISPGYQPRVFAYPNGEPGVDFTETHMRIVRDAGFEAAFSSRDGGFPIDPLRCHGLEMFHLPRFLPHRKWAPARALSALKIAGETTWKQSMTPPCYVGDTDNTVCAKTF